MAIVFKQEVIDTIEKNMKAVQTSYNELAEASWHKKIESLEPYKPTPKKGCFYDDESKTEYNNKVATYKDETLKVINDYISSVEMAASDAPSEEALRAVQMFSLVDAGSMDQETYANLIDALMNRYGSSLVTYETLRSFAQKAGIMDFKEHPELAAPQSAEEVERLVCRYFDSAKVLSFESEKNISDGMITLTLASIKNNLKVIEAWP